MLLEPTSCFRAALVLLGWCFAACIVAFSAALLLSCCCFVAAPWRGRDTPERGTGRKTVNCFIVFSVWLPRRFDQKPQPTGKKHQVGRTPFSVGRSRTLQNERGATSEEKEEEAGVQTSQLVLTPSRDGKERRESWPVQTGITLGRLVAARLVAEDNENLRQTVGQAQFAIAVPTGTLFVGHAIRALMESGESLPGSSWTAQTRSVSSRARNRVQALLNKAPPGDSAGVSGREQLARSMRNRSPARSWPAFVPAVAALSSLHFFQTLHTGDHTDEVEGGTSQEGVVSKCFRI